MFRWNWTKFTAFQSIHNNPTNALDQWIFNNDDFECMRWCRKHTFQIIICAWFIAFLCIGNLFRWFFFFIFFFFLGWYTTLRSHFTIALQTVSRFNRLRLFFVRFCCLPHSWYWFLHALAKYLSAGVRVKEEKTNRKKPSTSKLKEHSWNEKHKYPRIYLLYCNASAGVWVYVCVASIFRIINEHFALFLSCFVVVVAVVGIIRCPM